MSRRRIRLDQAPICMAAVLSALGIAGCSYDEPAAELPFYADVFASDPAWSEVRRISAGDGLYYMPCVHPAGTHVVFCGAASGPPRIWETDLATGAIVALTPPDSAAMVPSYSWDGGEIVFTSDRAAPGEPMPISDAVRGSRPSGGPFDLYKLDRVSGAVVRLTDCGTIAHRPTFSPDGKTVAFTSTQGKPGARLWLVAGDGSGGAKQMLPNLWVARPWYAADSKSLFFHTNVRGRHQVCRYEFERGWIKPLANDTFDKTHGSFVDPATDSLLVHAVQDDRWGLWELPLDGTTPPTLITPPGFDTATHVTRSRNGVIAFDQARDSATR